MQDDPLYFWRLAPELSVIDAAILIPGGNPSETELVPTGSFYGGDVDEVKKTTGHPGFTPVFSALKAAILRGDLPATLRYRSKRGGELEPDLSAPFWIVAHDSLQAIADTKNDYLVRLASSRSIYVESEPDWDASTINVPDLRKWLESRGHTTGFFFPAYVEARDSFMDQSHEHYSPELALAVSAWRALASVQRFPRGTKDAIQKWIDENPSEWCGDSELSASAKERIVTLVNWRKSGGAPSSGG